jgi:hypothetical protein
MASFSGGTHSSFIQAPPSSRDRDAIMAMQKNRGDAEEKDRNLLAQALLPLAVGSFNY